MFIIKNIDGTDWQGVKSGFFSRGDYIIDMSSHTITYTNGLKIVAENLVIPDYVKYKGINLKVLLGERCFEDNYFISGSVEFNQFITNIPKYCFSYCLEIDELIFHKPPKVFDEYAFNYCSINHIYVKTNGELSDDFAWEITVIGDFAFNNNDIQKESLVFGPSFRQLGMYAFANNFEIETIDMSYCTDLMIIGEGAFAGCSSLQSVYLSPATTNIEANAFSYCKFLDMVYLPKPNMSFSLGNGAFYECTYFRSFSQPFHILSMDETCFTFDTNIQMQPWLPEYDLNFIPKHAFESCGYTYLSFPHGSTNDVRDYAFYGNQNLRVIDFSGLLPGDPVPNWPGRQIFAGITQSSNDGPSKQCKLLIPYCTSSMEEWTQFCERQGLSRDLWTIEVPSDGLSDIQYDGPANITLDLQEGRGTTIIGNFRFVANINFMPEWLSVLMKTTNTNNAGASELWTCTPIDMDLTNKTFKMQIELSNGTHGVTRDYDFAFVYRNILTSFAPIKLHITIN